MKYKNNPELIMSIVLIFCVGCVIGYNVNLFSLSRIQGYLFNAVNNLVHLNATDSNATDSNATDSNATDSNATDSNATDSNATDSNATDSNATDSNATDSNATDSNATDSNATDSNATDSNATDSNAEYCDFDNGALINDFNMETVTAKPEETIYLSIVSLEAEVKEVKIVFKSLDNGAVFTANVDYLYGVTQTIDIPSNVVPATYYPVQILAVGENCDGSTFTKMYDKYDNYLDDNFHGFDATITVINDETTEKVNLNSFSINKTNAIKNDKVYFNYETSEEITDLRLTFESSNDVMHVYAKSLNNNPYFEVPETAEIGEYTLKNITVYTNDTNAIYTNEEHTLKVSANQTNKYIYSNDAMTNSTINDIESLPNDAEIIIDIKFNTIIDERIFEAIEDTNKTLVLVYKDNQMIFKGKDIVDYKTIDVSITLKDLNSVKEISETVENGVIVSFASNGQLPGLAKVRIKATKQITDVLKNNSVNVYYYNESVEKYEIIKEDVALTQDGYYEFEIDHNSDFVLTKNKLHHSLIIDGKEVVTFQKSDLILIGLVGVGVLAILFTVIIILAVKKKEKIDF